MGIMALVLTAVIMTSFGSQSFLAGSQTNAEATKKAQGLLERQQALARKDFNLVNSTRDIQLDATGFCASGLMREKDEKGNDDIYCDRVDVANYENPVTNIKNYFMKIVTATVKWKDERGMERSVVLSTLVANFNNASGGNTCNSSPLGDWQNPQIKNNTHDFASLAGLSGTYQVTDADAYEDKLYVTATNTSFNTNPTLFIFNTNKLINNLANPLITSTDNASVGAGLNAVVVDGNYAYVANGYGANFGSCTQAGNCAQLQIFNLDNITAPPINFKVPGVTGSGGQGIGNSIFYKNGYIYLGLTKTLTGPEFNIIDVHNLSTTPPSLVTGGTYSVGNGINSIYVNNGYAYLATPNSQEITVLDISSPSTPLPKENYDAPDSAGNGKSLYSVGDNLYLGRTVTSTNPEFYILDNSDPTKLQTNNANPYTKEIGSSVNGLIVRDYLLFVLTNNQLRILDITDPANIINWASGLSLPGATSTGGSSLDCEGNYLYAGTYNNGGLYIIGP